MIWLNLSINAFCNSQWDDFLQQLNMDTFMMLEKNFTANGRNCDLDIMPEQIHRTKLFELIRKGNQLAFRASLLVSKCWDGGELGDFNRSVGLFFEVKPQVFLQIVIDKNITDRQLNYMLTMLPLHTVDNIDLKIAMLENRIDTLRSLNEKKFITIRKRGILRLEKAIDNLIKIKKTIN